MNHEIWTGINAFLPELMIILTILLLIVLEVAPGKKSQYMIPSMAVCGVFLAFLFTLVQLPVSGQAPPTGLIFYGMITVDSFSIYFKLLFLLTALLTLILTQTAGELRGKSEAEYCILTLTSVLGMFLFVASSNLLMLYLSIEMISIPSYVLTGFFRSNRRSTEASVKYVIYGAVASGMMIYGFSLLYGMTGTLQLSGIRDWLAGAAPVNPAAMAIIAMLILAGFGYKVAAVPFHMWCPDIYEGAPTPITAFLSVGPKAAGFGALLRFLYTALGPGDSAADGFLANGQTWSILLSVLSVLTMSVGNLAALMQNNLKRMMAYSSIAHAGYLLMGCAVLNRAGLSAVLFYLSIYLLMNFGAFLLISLMAERTGSEQISAFRGLGWKCPFAGVAMCFFLFSLAGLPPSAGFVGKLYLFSALLKEGWHWLALAGLANSVVSLFYYARIVRTMFFDGQPQEGQVAEAVSFGPAYHALLGILAAPLLLLGVYWAPLYDFAQNSVQWLGHSR